MGSADLYLTGNTLKGRSMRPSGRNLDELRPISIETGVMRHAEGSCLIRCGDTHVLCSATIEDKAPPFLKGSGQGWVTAEYGMLPRATTSRNRREDLLVTLARHEAPVVLVDNGSTDGTVDAVRAAHPEVCVVPLGQNLGARARTPRGRHPERCRGHRARGRSLDAVRAARRSRGARGEDPRHRPRRSRLDRRREDRRTLRRAECRGRSSRRWRAKAERERQRRRHDVHRRRVRPDARRSGRSPGAAGPRRVARGRPCGSRGPARRAAAAPS